MSKVRHLALALGAAVIGLGASAGPSAAAGTLPTAAIQSAVGAKGTTSHGVLSIPIDRNDIADVHIGSTPIKPSFEIDGELDFQALGHNRAFMNGDIPVKPNEINPVIDAITTHGLTFQAEHQHLYDFDPMVWFIHIRGKGNAVKLAKASHAVLAATSTPLPQEPPSNPTTPLDKNRLESMLHGYDAEVGDDGVVTVYVTRRNAEHIDGVKVKAETNISTNISFEPLNASGSQTAVVPDFGMTANEIDPVIRTMRAQGWDIGCLYNQETDEHPQLYFSHVFKTGDPYVLAGEIAKGLHRMNVG